MNIGKSESKVQKKWFILPTAFTVGMPLLLLLLNFTEKQNEEGLIFQLFLSFSMVLLFLLPLANAVLAVIGMVKARRARRSSGSLPVGYYVWGGIILFVSLLWAGFDIYICLSAMGA